MPDAALLRGFRSHVAALPAHVGAWVTGALWATVSATERIAERNELLRMAAALLPGSTRAAAAQLRAEAVGIRRAMPTHPDLATPRGCVAEAMLVCPGRILSVRQICRILQATDKRGLVLSQGVAIDSRACRRPTSRSA